LEFATIIFYTTRSSALRPTPNMVGQDGPITRSGTGFPFHRLLRLSGLRWRHSIPPQHEVLGLLAS
jgi:hypothetical protein